MTCFYTWFTDGRIFQSFKTTFSKRKSPFFFFFVQNARSKFLALWSKFVLFRFHKIRRLSVEIKRKKNSMQFYTNLNVFDVGKCEILICIPLKLYTACFNETLNKIQVFFFFFCNIFHRNRYFGVFASSWNPYAFKNYFDAYRQIH